MHEVNRHEAVSLILKQCVLSQVLDLVRTDRIYTL